MQRLTQPHRVACPNWLGQGGTCVQSAATMLYVEPHKDMHEAGVALFGITDQALGIDASEQLRLGCAATAILLDDKYAHAVTPAQLLLARTAAD